MTKEEFLIIAKTESKEQTPVYRVPAPFGTRAVSPEQFYKEIEEFDKEAANKYRAHDATGAAITAYFRSKLEGK